MKFSPATACALACAAILAAGLLTGCAALTAAATAPEPACARLDLPHRHDTVRVRCPDGQQRYVSAGAAVSLADVCLQPRRFPAEPQTVGAFCLRPKSSARVASAAADGNAMLTLEAED